MDNDNGQRRFLRFWFVRVSEIPGRVDSRKPKQGYQNCSLRNQDFAFNKNNYGITDYPALVTTCMGGKGALSSLDGDGNYGGGFGGEAKKGYAGNSGGNSANDPAIDRRCLFFHEAFSKEGVDLGIESRVAKVLGARGVDELAVKLEGNDGGEGVTDNNGTFTDSTLDVASLVRDGVANNVLASFSVSDLCVVNLRGDVKRGGANSAKVSVGTLVYSGVSGTESGFGSSGNSLGNLHATGGAGSIGTRTGLGGNAVFTLVPGFTGGHVAENRNALEVGGSDEVHAGLSQRISGFDLGAVALGVESLGGVHSVCDTDFGSDVTIKGVEGSGTTIDVGEAGLNGDNGSTGYSDLGASGVLNNDGAHERSGLVASLVFAVVVVLVGAGDSHVHFVSGTGLYDTIEVAGHVVVAGSTLVRVGASGGGFKGEGVLASEGNDGCSAVNNNVLAGNRSRVQGLVFASELGGVSAGNLKVDLLVKDRGGGDNVTVTGILAHSTGINRGLAASIEFNGAGTIEGNHRGGGVLNNDSTTLLSGRVGGSIGSVVVNGVLAKLGSDHTVVGLYGNLAIVVVLGSGAEVSVGSGAFGLVGVGTSDSDYGRSGVTDGNSPRVLGLVVGTLGAVYASLVGGNSFDSVSANLVGGHSSRCLREGGILGNLFRGATHDVVTNARSYITINVVLGGNSGAHLVGRLGFDSFAGAAVVAYDRGGFVVQFKGNYNLLGVVAGSVASVELNKVSGTLGAVNGVNLGESLYTVSVYKVDLASHSDFLVYGVVSLGLGHGARGRTVTGSADNGVVLTGHDRDTAWLNLTRVGESLSALKSKGFIKLELDARGRNSGGRDSKCGKELHG